VIGPLPESVTESLQEAWELGLALDLVPAKPALQRLVQEGLAAVATDPTIERITGLQRLIEDARAYQLRFGLWQTQNRFLEIWRARPEARTALVPLGARLDFNLDPERP
jgi:hypothetical protein